MKLYGYYAAGKVWEVEYETTTGPDGLEVVTEAEIIRVRGVIADKIREKKSLSEAELEFLEDCEE